MVTSDRVKWSALALLCAVQFMVVLDVAIVNVALPSIQADLGFSQANLQWVISAYALVFGGFLLLGGRLADILGRIGVFMGASSSSRSARSSAVWRGVTTRSSRRGRSRASARRRRRTYSFDPTREMQSHRSNETEVGR
jgi:Major Facilitator Superfamily